jgi:hypothetical protein
VDITEEKQPARLSVLVSKPTRRALERLAALSSRSFSAEVRVGLRRHIDREIDALARRIEEQS